MATAEKPTAAAEVKHVFLFHELGGFECGAHVDTESDDDSDGTECGRPATLTFAREIETHHVEDHGGVTKIHYSACGMHIRQRAEAVYGRKVEFNRFFVRDNEQRMYAKHYREEKMRRGKEKRHKAIIDAMERVAQEKLAADNVEKA